MVSSEVIQDKRKLINSALALLGRPYCDNDVDATILLLAIGLQESSFQTEFQVPVAHARGWWQFEKGGGVWGVANHAATKKPLLYAVDKLGEWPDHSDKAVLDVPFLYERLDNDEVLAAVMARLLLWTDPNPLPNEEDEAWHYYLRTWRPGKPHRERWTSNWKRANIEWCK